MRKDRIRTQAAIFILIAWSVMVSGCIVSVETDYGNETEITAVNASSSDLHVVFSHLSLLENNIRLPKGRSVPFVFAPAGMSGWEKEYHHNPNKKGTKIVISNYIAGKIGRTIKEMDTANEDAVLFEFMGYRGSTALYRFTITDDLLRD